MRKTLKILSIALAATMLIALCAVFFASNTEVDAVDYNTGDFAVNGSGGRDWNNFIFNGTSYPIDKTVTNCAGTITVDGTVYHLVATSNQLKGTFLSDSAAQNILIACDITFETPSAINNTAGDVIDGLGHTITFSNATKGWFNNFKGDVKNLNFAGELALTNHGAPIATWFQGGTIDKVVNDADIPCDFSKQTNNDGSEYAAFGAYVGGIVGRTQGVTTISNCVNNGDIYIVDGDTLNTHARLGGITAYCQTSKLTVINCQNTGDISHPRATANMVAGLVAGMKSELEISGSSNSGKITSNYLAGGIAGTTDTSSIKVTITDCHNTGDVTGVNKTAGIVAHVSGACSMVDSSNSGSVYSSGAIAAGLAGQLAGTSTVTDCSNTGSISGPKNNTAGIVGQSAIITISGCTNGSQTDATKGVIDGASNTGGILGYSGGTLDMDNCVNYASVTSSSAAGGLVGKLHGNTTIDNSHNWGAITTTGSNNVNDANAGGGLVGGCRTSSTFKITGCTNNGDVTSAKTAYVGGILGTYARNNPNITIDSCVNNGDVILAAESQRFCAAGGVTAGPAAYNLYSNSAVMNPTVTIKNTINNGNIICQGTANVDGENAYSDIAGIIARTGKAATYTHDTAGEVTTSMVVVIENCVNTGDMIDAYPATSSAAGIIARIEVTEETSSVTITNCYSTGAFDLASGKGANALGNDLAESNVTVSNYFYLNGTDADFAESTEQVSEAAMAGGYVAYELGWGQKIGVDAAPVLGSTDTVYAVALKATAEGDALATTYSNTNADKLIALAHAGVQKREDVTGYRVLTSIDAYDYELLAKAGVDFQLGTLITADKYGVSTYEELQAAGKPCVIVTAINGAWYDATETANTFAGSLLQIKEANLDMDYAVRGYIEIDGTIIYTDEVVVCYNDLVA